MEQVPDIYIEFVEEYLHFSKHLRAVGLAELCAMITGPRFALPGSG